MNGRDVPFVNVSAKLGQNIDRPRNSTSDSGLDGTQGESEFPAKGTVIEAKLDKNKFIYFWCRGAETWDSNCWYYLRESEP